MKILFITSNLIGDSILSTGVLSHIIKSHKQSKITIVVGPTARPLFEYFPNIEQIITIKKMKYSLHWLNLWKIFIFKKWDLIIDLRSSYISYFLITKKRKIFKNNNEDIHQIHKLTQFMNQKKYLKPKIFINEELREEAKNFVNNNIVIAISPGGNWKPKIWPTKNYNKLIKDLIKIYSLKKLRFLIVGSKEEEEEYYNQLSSNLEEEIIINFMGRSLIETFAILSYCKLFIGNDSGLMHLAASSNIPTIGLFGPTKDSLYAPFGDRCHVIRTKEGFKYLRSRLKDSKTSLMDSILVEDIINLIKNEKLII